LFLLNNLTLQMKISLLVLTGLMLSLALFSILSITSLNESTQTVLNQRLDVARIIANDLDENMAHMAAHLNSATNRLNALPSFEEFFQLSTGLRETFSDAGLAIQNVVLIDGNGMVKQVYYTNPAIIGADLSHLPEVNTALNTSKSLISNQLTEPITNTQMVMAISPIRNIKGEIPGLMAVLFDIKGSSMHAVTNIFQAGNTGYFEIVDGNGMVIARTEPGIIPGPLEKTDHPDRFSDLIKEKKAVVSTCHRCHEVNQEIKRRRDIIAFAPLSTVPWGVAIRQSEDEALIPTRQLESRLLLLGIILLIGALALIWFMAQSVVKPLRILKTAAQKVATGDFKAVIPFVRNDEIGQLSHSFYSMTQELAKSRDQLLSRNKELTALNSVSIAVSQSLDLKDISDIALRNVMEVTQTTAGCFMLPRVESNQLDVLMRIGPPGIFDCKKVSRDSSNCTCNKVLLTRQSTMVNDASQCPLLKDDAWNINSFASIPLKSKDEVLGIINVACPEGRYFTQEDFEMFDSIGFQIGLALENSILYSITKQKQELRGQLLNKVIDAQEEERKRIARELHDESGQALTAAIMNIESIEVIIPPDESPVAEKLASIKRLIVHTLENLRRMTRDLRPMALDDLGLVTAIRSHVKEHLDAAGIKLTFESSGLNAGSRLSPAIETALFRIIQEATNNIIKHADAKNVYIQLFIEGDMINAVIKDDGKGFDIEAALKSDGERQTLGILGIKERVDLLGGTFSIASRSGDGTQLSIKVPAAYLESGKTEVVLLKEKELNIRTPSK